MVFELISEFGFQIYCGLFCGRAWVRQAEKDKKSARYVLICFDRKANRGRDLRHGVVMCVDPQSFVEQVFCQIRLRSASFVMRLCFRNRDFHLNQ